MSQNIISNVEQLLKEKKLKTSKMQTLQKWTKKIIENIPDYSPVRVDTISYERSDYLLISFPVEDILNDPWKVNNLNLTTVLYRASEELNFVARYQDHGNFSGLTIRINLNE